MDRLHPIGEIREIMPIPPIADHMVTFLAGVLTIGVEYRVLDQDVVREFAVENPTAEGFIDSDRSYDDQGVSIHVFDAETNQEYLRFDNFGEDPHYHYILPGRGHIGIGFDENANGDYAEWIFRSLTERVSAMLGFAGAEDLARRVEPQSIQSVMADVRAAVDHVATRSEPSSI